MPITMQQILARLDTDEPEYAALAALGPEAIPHLKVLVRSDDPGIAAKAAYLATLINTDESADIMEAASASPHETVRVAAAAGMRNLTAAKAGPWVERLLDDSDPGVRKQALQTVSALDLSLDPKLAKISSSDPEKELRVMAKDLQRASDTTSSVKTTKKAGKKTKSRKK
jgi:HEAT repeat protein